MDVPFARQMGNKSAHAQKLQQHLHDQMLSQSDFCDVTLIVGEIEVKAHWNVLVSCPYFQSLYDSGLAEKYSGTVKLHVGKPAAVRAAISFLYMGTAEVTYDNVKDLLEVADYFQIMDLKRACQDYLYSVNVNIDNCVQICLLCSLYDLELYTRAFDFLRGNLPEVMEKDDILTLTHESVLSLLNDETLCYVSLEAFYHFIIRWTRHSLEQKEINFEELFCALDLTRVSKQFLEETIEKEDLVNRHEKCKIHVLNMKMKYMAGLIKEDAGMRDVILIAGGCGHGLYFNNLFHLFPFNDCISVSNVYGYIIQEGRWIELPPLPEQMKKPLLTYNAEAGFLYVFNTNHANVSSLFIVYKFNIQEKTWTSFRIRMPENISSVSFHSMLWCNNALYAVISAHIVNSKSPPTEQWQTVLLQVKEDGEESVLKCNFFQRNISTQIAVCMHGSRSICVLGWKHGSKAKKGKQTVKFYIYETELQKRFDQSRGAYWEPLLVQQGNDLVTCRFGKYSARSYSFTERKWKLVKEMVIPHPPGNADRSEYSSFSDGDNFYVFGGKDFASKAPVDMAFKYNFSSKEWTDLASMPQKLMQSGVCTVRMPAEHVRCHISCPHCIYHSRKSQAVYDLDFPYDDVEDDTDYEYSVDDDDEEYPSDPWEDNFDYFDPYEDWY